MSATFSSTKIRNPSADLKYSSLPIRNLRQSAHLCRQYARLQLQSDSAYAV